MIKLIASDMDGTLLNEKGQIPKTFWALERKLRSQGVYFCVASGRQYFNLKNLFHRIKENTIFIAENGALVMFQDEIICEHSMDKTDLKEWNQITKDLDNVQIIFCAKNTAYIETPKNENLLNEMKKYYHKLEIIDSLEAIEEDLLKLAVCDLEGSEKNSYQYLKKFEGKYQIVVSSGMWLDFMTPKTNKGNALEEIKKRFGIKDDELLIFGDYLNDYEMLACGKHSYAMENAHPLLKKRANYMAPNNKEEGVIQIIKTFFNI